VFWPLSRFRTWLGWLAFRRAVSSAAVLNLSRFLQSTVRPLFLQRYLRPECAWRHGYAGGLVYPEISQRPVKSIYLTSLPRTFACACCPKVKVGRAPTCQTQLGWRCEWCFPVIRLLFWKGYMSRATKGGKSCISMPSRRRKNSSCQQIHRRPLAACAPGVLKKTTARPAARNPARRKRRLCTFGAVSC
jgi:hypothetical protein